MPGGIGSWRPPVVVSSQNSSSWLARRSAADCRASSAAARPAAGSITAPDRMCAPIVEAFSITQTEISGSGCLRRIANDNPAGTGTHGNDVVLHDVAFDFRHLLLQRVAGPGPRHGAAGGQRVL
jgi:hypothetical protein